MNKLTSVGVLPLVAQLICGVGDGHGQERGILWYRNTAGITDVFIDISPSGGTGVDQRVTDVSTNWLATDADATPNFGDYINLTSSVNGFHAVWADGRRGDPDVFYATITP